MGSGEFGLRGDAEQGSLWVAVTGVTLRVDAGGVSGMIGVL